MKSTELKQALYMIAVPIGNTGDLTERAKYILEHAGTILCEDTRTSHALFKAAGITPGGKILACNEHKEEKIASLIADPNKLIWPVAFISDAGTPGICDPGSLLVKAARLHKREVVAIPGASSLTAFLSILGNHSQYIVFTGFLPRSRGDIERAALRWQKDSQLIVFLESPHRVEKTMEILSEILPSDTQAYLGRELTKTHEQFVAGSPTELKDSLNHSIPVLGEFIIAIEIKEKENNTWKEAALELAPSMGTKKTAHWMSTYLNIPKNEVYKFLTSREI